MASSSWPICLSRSGICRIGGVEHLLGLQHIQLGGNAVVEPQPGQLDGLFLSLDRVLGDLELEVEIEKPKIVTGDVAHQRQRDSLLRILGGQEFGARGLSCASQAAEKIQLECGVGSESQKIVLRLRASVFSAVEVGVPVHLRKQTGARDRDLSARGGDAFRRQLQIVILLQRCADQFLQLRVLEDLPPGKVCKGCRLGLSLWVSAQITVHAVGV